jgi:predicted secreted protein
MHRTLIIFLFISVSGLIINSCSSGAASGTLTEKDNGKTIELEMDSPFTIRLTGEHDSGLSWKLVSDNKPVIAFEKSETTIDGNKDIYIFTFKTENEGEQIIEIVYGNNSGIMKTFKLKVICGTMGRILSE